jgi:hypothetical protein
MFYGPATKGFGVRRTGLAALKRGFRPHRGVKPLRGSSTSLVPRSVTALRVSATPPFYEI